MLERASFQMMSSMQVRWQKRNSRGYSLLILIWTLARKTTCKGELAKHRSFTVVEKARAASHPARSRDMTQDRAQIRVWRRMTAAA